MRSLVLALAAAIVLAGAASAARAQVVVASPYGTGVYASPSYNPYAGIGVNLGVTQVGEVAYPAYPTYPSYGVYTTPYYGGYPYVSLTAATATATATLTAATTTAATAAIGGGKSVVQYGGSRRRKPCLSTHERNRALRSGNAHTANGLALCGAVFHFPFATSPVPRSSN